MFKYQLKRNVFFKFFLSYFFITAIPIIASRYIIQNYFISNYTQKVIEQHIKTCDETKDEIDSNLIQFKKIVAQIENAKAFSSQYIRENKTAFLDIVPTLNMLKNMNTMLYDIVYIDLGTNTIFSSYGQWNPEFYVPYITMSENKSDVSDFISFQNGEYFVPSSNISNFLGFDQLIEYVVPIRNNESVLIFKIMEPMFGKMLQTQMLSSASSFIIDADNKIIYQSNPDTSEEEINRIVQSLNGSGSGKSVKQTNLLSEASDKDKFIIELNSVSAPIKYVFSMAYEDVMFDVNKLQRIIFLSYIAISMMCIVLIYIFTRFNYKPVKKLIHLIKEITSTIPSESNEFKIIEHTLDTMHKNNEQLKTEINSALQDKMLLKLIGHEYSDNSDIEKDCMMSGIVFSNPCYGVFITMIEENIEINDACEINNTTKLLLQEYMDIYYTQYIEHNTHVFIISVPDEAFNLKDILNQTITSVNSIFKRNDIVIGVGNIYSNLCDLFKSFNEAKIAIKCKYNFNEDNILIYNQLHGLQKCYYPDIEMNGLYNSIISQNSEKVEFLCTMLINIIKNDFSGSVISISLCHDVFNTFLRALIYTNKFTSEIEDIYKSFYLKSDFCTIDEFVHYIRWISTEIVKGFDNNNDTNPISIDKVLEYIEKNVTNPMLSVGNVADYFNMSLSSLSRFFKENTGINISDYINRLHIKYAKMLLLSTDNTVQDISQILGYTQSSSFIRKFKQMEGITPNEYRYQSMEDNLRNFPLNNIKTFNES